MNFDFISNPNLLSFYLETGFYYFFRFFLGYGIWILLALLILRILWKHWVDKNKKKFLSQQKYVLLGVSMPKDNKQGPEAIEKFFVHLAGIKEEATWYEKNIQGKTQLNISLEVASIEGQIQFFIYTPVQFRDLVKSAIYTSYPDLEIFEQDEDYSEDALEDFLEDQCNVWGADLTLSEQNPIPIKTYSESGHKFSKELEDPLTDLFEILGSLRESEQVWIQFIVSPIKSELKADGQRLIKNILLGENLNKKAKDNIVDKTAFSLIKFTQNVLEFLKEVLNLHPTTDSFDESKEKHVSLPGDKRLIDAIQNKISKIAFKSCIRIIYLADKEVFVKDRGITGILGAFNAFRSIDMNSFKVSLTTGIIKKNLQSNKILDLRKQEILKAYKKRAFSWKVKSGFPKVISRVKKFLTIPEPKSEKTILNTEELATIYHFPVNIVKASLVKKTSSKRGEPPLGLPVK